MQGEQNFRTKNKIINNLGYNISTDFSLRLFWLKYVENNKFLYNGSQNQKEHSHSFFELLVIAEGMVEYAVNQTTVKVETGEYIIFSPKIKHQLIEYSDIIKKYTIAFNYTIDDPDGDNYDIAKPFYVGKQTEKMLFPLKYVMDNVDEKNKNDILILKYQMNAFFWALWDNIGIEGKPDNEKKELAPNDAEFFEMVCDYLRKHVSNKVSLDDVAKSLNISERQLNRRILKYNGESFGRVRDNVKCSIARDLLSTNMSMSEISDAIGMSSEYSFNRFFKRVEGLTPGTYREAIRSSNYK